MPTIQQRSTNQDLTDASTDLNHVGARYWLGDYVQTRFNDPKEERKIFTSLHEPAEVLVHATLDLGYERPNTSSGENVGSALPNTTKVHMTEVFGLDPETQQKRTDPLFMSKINICPNCVWPLNRKFCKPIIRSIQMLDRAIERQEPLKESHHAAFGSGAL